MQMNNTKHANTINHDLHGLVGVRFVNPTARDAAVVASQLGPLQTVLRREPDITIRFAEHLEGSSPLRLLGLDDADFSDDGFFVLRSRQKARVKVSFAFEQIGTRHCEIQCESGLAPVPLLIAIINLTYLSKGVRNYFQPLLL